MHVGSNFDPFMGLQGQHELVNCHPSILPAAHLLRSDLWVIQRDIPRTSLSKQFISQVISQIEGAGHISSWSRTMTIANNQPLATPPHGLVDSLGIPMAQHGQVAVALHAAEGVGQRFALLGRGHPALLPALGAGVDVQRRAAQGGEGAEMGRVTLWSACVRNYAQDSMVEAFA